MVHKREALSLKERLVRKLIGSNLTALQRKTEKPLVIGMIGLVGSGKSTVANYLAPRIGATVVSADKIRVELRQEGEKYEKTRAIAEDLATEIIKSGGNVIIDSDFIDQAKRASLREKCRKMGADVIFIRTHCNFDVATGRIIIAQKRGQVDAFFSGADSDWH